MTQPKISVWFSYNPSCSQLQKIKTMGRFILRASLFLGLTIYLQACDASKAAKEDKKMLASEEISIFQNEKPPIDVSAPDQTETATFALG